jgi:hypothetical protein
MPNDPWFCVIACRTYQLLYVGTDAAEAAAVSNDESFCGQGSTIGEAQRKAALGAGKKTQSRRPPPSPGRRLGPE